MTQDEIIELARQAGMELDDSFVLEEDQIWYFCKENFIAFAKLVASAASAKEREACAKVCESLFDPQDDTCDEAEQCAAAIRARGEA
jgi:hypothetical protein